MKTACFFMYPWQGPGRISIARYPPRGWIGDAYPSLAPGPWFKSVGQQEYIRLYSEQLSKLDPRRVVKDLEDLAAPAEPVLLCWERPHHFCHRHLVAKWLKNELGLIVLEGED
jgi:uncharacterized protein (DUF488 family)